MSHTQGPWFLSRGAVNGNEIDAFGCVDGNVGECEFHVATIWADADEIREQAEANATLIAAAPELLAACKLALSAFEHNHAIDWSDLERAIAKAEGTA